MSQLIKLVSSGISLASEAYKASQASKTGSGPQYKHYIFLFFFFSPQPLTINANPERAAARTQANELIARGEAVPVPVPCNSKGEEMRGSESESEDGVPFSEGEEDDEELWALDEATSPGAETSNPTSPTSSPKEPKTIASIFLAQHPPPPPTTTTTQLPCTVTLPQRRPKFKTRGFVRAYAPALADCSISARAFLAFLKAFHSASKEDPWLHVVNIAAMAAGMAPSVTAMAVSAAVQVGVGVAMEVQRRSRLVLSALCFPVWKRKEEREKKKKKR
ncbi:hypothetical protein LARI1_G008984 [Lachnellula arida]|uniref:Uncharacterized protein n=1 Tax=Lachnellula arida TaxID=1316785 RepID=A0A8T9B3F9_9HELO|nr:hypothetical protein LARI1_G008984 [Lachnellula arida]